MVQFDTRLNSAIASGEYAIAKRLLTEQMRQAEEERDMVTLARSHHALGNIAELERRMGDAFRNWQQALWYYDAAGAHCSADTERIRDLLRSWTRIHPVFASYARSDGAIVAATLSMARRKGVKFKIDRDFLAGRSIEEQIRTAIASCPKFLVFHSEQYSQRSWTQFELELYKDKFKRDTFAHASKCCIIFFCLDETHRNDTHLEGFRSAIFIERSSGADQATSQLIRSLTQ